MMIIARAPTRISFGGDATDFPAYYEQHGGLVVSTSIGYGVHTVLNTTHLDSVQLLSADHRALSTEATCGDLILDENLQLPSAVIDFFRPRSGLVIFLASEVPPGSGLGSCGALAISMIKALSFWCGIDLEPAAVADIACQIQIEKLDMPVGRHDQHAVAFGGLNRIRFSSDGVAVEPLRLTVETEDALQRRLMLFFVGSCQFPSRILQNLKQKILDEDEEVLTILGRIKEVTLAISEALTQGDLSIFGELLHRSWVGKQRLIDGMTNRFIDECYDLARDHGAVGGTVSGVGGGFLVLYCREEHQERVTRALELRGLRRWPLTLDRQGVQLMEVTPWQRPGSDSLRWDTRPRLGSRAVEAV